MNNESQKCQCECHLGDYLIEGAFACESCLLSHKITPYSELSHTHCFDQKEPACGIKAHSKCCLCEKKNPKWIKGMEKSTGKDFKTPPEERKECQIKGITETGEEVSPQDALNKLRELVSVPNKEAPEVPEWENKLKRCFQIPFGPTGIYPKVLEFIRNLLETSRKEERQRIREKVEGMRKKVWPNDGIERALDIGYNTALSEVLEILKD